MRGPMRNRGCRSCATRAEPSAFDPEAVERLTRPVRERLRSGQATAQGLSRYRRGCGDRQGEHPTHRRLRRQPRRRHRSTPRAEKGSQHGSGMARRAEQDCEHRHQPSALRSRRCRSHASRSAKNKTSRLSCRAPSHTDLGRRADRDAQSNALCPSRRRDGNAPARAPMQCVAPCVSALCDIS